jgi:hypothetical protein
MEVEPMVLAERHPSDADSLVSTNVPDDLANEQTWPTEEEMQGSNHDGASAVPDAQKGTTPKRVKRIPKGWSEYQAAWIIDDESEGEEGEGEESSDNAGDDSVEEGGEDKGGQEEPEDMQDLVMDDQDMDQDTRRSVAFQDLDAEEESKQYASPGCSRACWADKYCLGSKTGGIEIARRRASLRSPTKSTHPKTSLPERDSNDIVACARSGRVHGIRTKICLGTMHEYSNSRISSGRNATSAAEPNERKGSRSAGPSIFYSLHALTAAILFLDRIASDGVYSRSS